VSKFFVNRPIVAIVIAVLMTIIGGVCILVLPIAQYPDIVPPEIQVRAHYTGADAQTIEQSVAAPIEQQMSGVDNMNYMYSLNANNGDMQLTVNFDVATDANVDQILAQLRVSQATSQLPADVNNYGVTVQKSTAAPLMLVSLYSPNQTYDGVFLANYAYINLVDQLTIRDALVGQARSARQTGNYGPGNYQRGPKAEHGKSGRSDRRRTDSERTEVYLHRSRARTVAITGGIRRNHRSSKSRRLICAGERYRAHRSRRPNL
jgi:hypothetical protein